MPQHATALAFTWQVRQRSEVRTGAYEGGKEVVELASCRLLHLANEGLAGHILDEHIFGDAGRVCVIAVCQVDEGIQNWDEPLSAGVQPTDDDLQAQCKCAQVRHPV